MVLMIEKGKFCSSLLVRDRLDIFSIQASSIRLGAESRKKASGSSPT